MKGGRDVEVKRTRRETGLILTQKSRKLSGYCPYMVVVFPELSTEEEEEEGDDEDGSSDEFTDSIEEDDDKVTARSLSFIQVKCFYLHFTVKYL